MVSVLITGIAFIYRILLILFVKKSLLEDATSLVKLANVDPQLNVNQKENESVDSGFGAKAVVSDLRKKYV